MRHHPLTRVRSVALAAALAGLSLAFGSSGGSAQGLTGARSKIAVAPAKSPAHAGAPRLDNGPDTASLSFELSGTATPIVSLLADPDRVLIDLPQVDFATDASAGSNAAKGRGKPRDKSRDHDLVASFRSGLIAADRSRIIVDLGAPARATASIRTIGAKTALVVDLTRIDRAAFVAAVARGQAASAPVVVAVAARPVPGKATIVLDPGHGGPDTGAIVGGVVEKDVTLAFAKSLASKLEAAGGFNVVMTRASDIFIPLSERVRVARESSAALMISIHADTLPETADVSGATVYTVSDKASDAYAAKVAAKENAADAAVGVDGQADKADVNDILFDLTRQETRAYSHVFARTLVNYWTVAGRLNKNPRRSAGFVVLKAPDVPSVLLELGYLSNPLDSAQLTADGWRDTATSRMAEAIEAYFSDRNGTAKAAAGVPMALPTGAASRQANADLPSLRR